MTRPGLPATAALAAAAALAAPAARAGDWGGVFSAVTWTSDYRYHGLSSSDRQPALQGYAHWQRPDGSYLGAFATQADYGYAQGPSFEVDVYGGKAWKLDQGRTELKAEAMYSLFPDDETPGPTFDFLTFKLAAKRTAGKLGYGAAAAFIPNSPYVSRRGYRVEGEAAYDIAPNLQLKALAGHIWTERGQDRTFWELGAAATWKRLTFGLRYVDTSLSRVQCGFNPDVCGPGVVGSLTASLPPIL
jgi:uncharacterized protein (TIGR02001 family)